MARIVIGGDFCPTGVNAPLARSGDVAGLFGDMAPFFAEADLSIINLECPLIREPSPIRKSGPALGEDEACAAVLEALGVDVVGLANNHAMDHGEGGLANTIDVCTRRGIAAVGAGRDLEEARRVHAANAGGLRVGVVAMAEHEFGVARRKEPGVNPLDVAAFVRAVEAHRDEVDLIVVLVHGGNEHYPYPRPSLMDACRFLVEQGADVVVCQHSHCPGCAEQYRGGVIVYGQGNLVFDSEGEPASWYSGVLICLDVAGRGEVRMELVPYVQSREGPGVRRMGPSDAADFMKRFDERSAEIEDVGVVDARWDAFCRERAAHYIRRFGAPHKVFRGLDEVTGLVQRFYSRWPLRLEHLNLIRCESHREVLINVLSREPELPRLSAGLEPIVRRVRAGLGRVTRRLR